MPTRLILVAHAATAATASARFPRDEDCVAPPAPDAGLARWPWLSAPEARARQTAAALSGASEVALDPDLADWDAGRWAGRDLADLSAREPAGLAAWFDDPAAAPHGGESLLALLARIEGWLARRAGLGRVVAATHPAVVRAAVVATLRSGPASFWRMDAAPLARAHLGHDGRRWVLRGLRSPGEA